MKEFKPHITEAKKKEVEEVKKLFNEYPVAGIVNLENLPTLQLQRIKKRLKDKIILKHTKKRFIKIAIDTLKEKKNILELKEKLKGVPALIFTKEDPFSLFQLLKKSQSSAVAKAGQEAPEDLTLPAGPTAFTPGPMIGELGQLGIKTEIKEGKIHVKEDKVLVKEGEVITAKVAELLAKIGIEPMKVGLNLTFTYEKGEILGKEVLGVDEEEYIQNIGIAHQEAFNVAVFSGYVTAETVEFLIQKAARESDALAKTSKVQTTETPREKPAEEKKEEQPKEEAPKEEEKKEESKEESVPEEPKEPEPPKEEEKKEEKVAESKPEEPKEDIPQKKSDTEVAQEVLQKLTEGKIKKQKQEPETKESTGKADANQPDMDKLINDLKDKKSKGNV